MNTLSKYPAAHSSKFYQQAETIGRQLATQVIRNNRYLLRKAGRTFDAQRKELEKKGIIVNLAYYCKITNGDKRPPNLFYLMIWAHYWDVPLWEMMSVDYESRDKLAAM